MRPANLLTLALSGALLVQTAACAPPPIREREALTKRGASDVEHAPPSDDNANKTPTNRLLVAGPEEVQPPPTSTGAIAAAAPEVPAPELAIAVRDPRPVRSNPRVRPLVVTELQGLESQVMNLPKTDPALPEILRRMTEGYVELESACLLELRSSQAALERASSSAERDQRQAEIKKMGQFVAASRLAVIRHATKLTSSFPNHCARPNAAEPTKGEGCADEATYFLALEQERARRLDEARRSYLTVIQMWPRSKYVPYAYLAFGELFFVESLSDPSKREFALQAYQEVVKYPPPQNEAWGYTQYQMANVYRAQEDLPRALSALKSAIDFSLKFPVITMSAELGAAARRDIIVVFASAGAPKKAREFFRPLSGDPKGQNTQLVRMLDELVRKYLRDNRSDAAADLCKSLTGGSDAPPACAELGGMPARASDPAQRR